MANQISFNFNAPITIGQPITTSNIKILSGTFNFVDGTGYIIVQYDNNTQDRIDSIPTDTFMSSLMTEIQTILTSRFGSTPTQS